MEKNMKTGIFSILTIACLLAPLHAFAESISTSRYTDSELIQIIKDEGYSAVTLIKDGAISIKIDGSLYVLLNKSDGDLQTYYAITGAKISHKDINEWNRTKRLSRAYLDSDNDPVLESDLLSNGGLTRKNVTEFFRIFIGSAKKFKEFIIEHTKS